MNSLSFEQAPPISVPVRFFLSAPAFGVLVGVVLLFLGADALQSRWSPATLALTHLLTVGFMLQAMCGALLQFVPVAAGGNIWRPRLVANLVHPALCAAALFFAAGFLAGRYFWLDAAAILFAAALGFYAFAVGSAIFRISGGGPTITALRLAVGSLLAAVTLGVLLVQMLQGRLALPVIQATNVHMTWGLAGWAGLLLIGVAYFVVPMFQMTPPYPQRLQRYLGTALLAALLLWSIQLIGDVPPAAANLALAALLVGSVIFAIGTLWLQAKRKRKVSDPTLQFFRGAMASIIAACIVIAAMQALAEDHPAVSLMLGILILHGIFGSAISGMLYKILPFALWMNLQQLDPALATKVSTRKLLGETPMTRHLRLHFLTLIVLLAAPLVPALARPAGILLIAAYGWLWWNLYNAVRNSLRFRPQRA
jgi:hypothetical protein